MMYWVKGTAVRIGLYYCDGKLWMEADISTAVSRSSSYSEPVPLNCELHECFPVSHTPTKLLE